MDDVQLAFVIIGVRRDHSFVGRIADSANHLRSMGLSRPIRVNLVMFLINIYYDWKISYLNRITMFGTSAKWLSITEDKIVPNKTHKLNTLRVIYSTGSPLKPSSFDYVYSSIKSDVLLGSISGKANFIMTLFYILI